jgi:hypothetical protein
VSCCRPEEVAFRQRRQIIFPPQNCPTYCALIAPQGNFSQCDQIGQNFAIWAKFFGVGRNFSEKCRPNDLGEIFFKKIARNSPNKL